MDEIGKLGFGFMRLPVVEGDGGKEIDIEQVKHMVDLFMDAGFTYFDTARGYHNGRSEAALREAPRSTSSRRSGVIGKKVCPEPNRNPCDKGRLHAGHSIAQQCPSAPPLHLFR